ncbi:MAG: hypothetical protein J1E39_00890, partial [Eubacterium sp.]|nr:hypothetical protein [Eubacterium sp.]
PLIGYYPIRGKIKHKVFGREYEGDPFEKGSPSMIDNIASLLTVTTQPDLCILTVFVIVLLSKFHKIFAFVENFCENY